MSGAPQVPPLARAQAWSDAVATAERVFDQISTEVDGLRRPRPDAAAWRAAADLAVGMRDALERSAETAGAPAAAAGPTSVLLVARSGAAAATQVWVHNRSADHLRDLVLVPTPLVAGSGAVVADDRLTVSPSCVDVDAGGRAVATLSVSVPDDAAPGTYDGHVGPADDRPTARRVGRLPVRLVVLP